MEAVRNTGGKKRLYLLAAAAVVATFVLPLVVVLPRPAHVVDEHIFEARLEEMLGQSNNGQLTYVAATTLDGPAPAKDVVLSFDRNYTRGWDPAKLDTGVNYWVEGSLMTPEVYFGEHYIFYGPPQLYVRQVKTGLLWPDQLTELRVLYLSPVSTLAAPIQVPLLFRSDGISSTMVAILALRCLLLGTTIVWSVRKRRQRTTVVLVLAIYALAAVALSLPVLGDLY